jgi:decaprenyl-phosphate phosphoribosyltransferase
MPARGRASLASFIRLARPKQWTKGAFVFLGALYSQKLFLPSGQGLFPALAAFLAFGFASSACYVLNDLRDAEADRAHPRKRLRPIAAGLVSPGQAQLFSLVLLVLAAGAVLLVPIYPDPLVPAAAWAKVLVGAAVLLYVINTLAYTRWLKHAPVADVISLALGFVLRVFGGCAAVAVEPSSWLLNCTFFLSMFLALGKRLGERRAFGNDTAAAAAARGVHALYTTDLLRMGTVVTAVATLLTYAGYVQDQARTYTWGFNLLWLTILPATYGLLRCMLMVDRGEFDDPTELATKDRPFQASIVVFGAITVALMIAFRKAAG